MYEELSKNVRRSWLLIIGTVIVSLGAGYGIAWAISGGKTAVGIGGLGVAGVVSIVMSSISYFAGDKIVLKLHRAQEATVEEHPRMHNIVEGLCIAGGIPKPKLYIIPDAAPNAFATGRDPAHASVAVTTGLLEKMNRVELEGVLAHELSHVKNRDTLVMVIVATLVGVVVLLADWALRAVWWGAAGSGRRRSSDDRGGAGGFFILFGILLAILMPIFAKIIQFSVSRRREFYADVTGVQMTRYPPGMISALEKLKADDTVVRTAAHATGHMWIEQPLDRSQGFGAKLNKLFSTHPPLDERIRVLREL